MNGKEKVYRVSGLAGGEDTPVEGLYIFCTRSHIGKAVDMLLDKGVWSDVTISEKGTLGPLAIKDAIPMEEGRLYIRKEEA
jgi:hypothetical protein